MTAADHANTVWARKFHEAYERLAPDFGYETRRESAVPWEDVPESNRALMVAVVGELGLAALQTQAETADYFSKQIDLLRRERDKTIEGREADRLILEGFRAKAEAERDHARLRYDILAATITGKTEFEVVAEKVDVEIRLGRMEADRDQARDALRQIERMALLGDGGVITVARAALGEDT